MSDKWMDVADVSLDDIIQMQKNKKGGTGKQVRKMHFFQVFKISVSFLSYRVLGMVFVVGTETA